MTYEQNQFKRVTSSAKKERLNSNPTRMTRAHGNSIAINPIELDSPTGITSMTNSTSSFTVTEHCWAYLRICSEIREKKRKKIKYRIREIQ